MDRVFVDTSGWVALFVENDINHKKFAEIFQQYKESKINIYTSDYVIDETITTILARGNHRDSVIAGRVLFESEIIKIVNVAPAYIQQTWEAYQGYKDKRFSFTDVSCFVIMKDLGIKKAVSFDKEFVKAGIELTF